VVTFHEPGSSRSLATKHENRASGTVSAQNYPKACGKAVKMPYLLTESSLGVDPSVNLGLCAILDMLVASVSMSELLLQLQST